MLMDTFLRYVQKSVHEQGSQDWAARPSSLEADAMIFLVR
jgi:hypothetical protein